MNDITQLHNWFTAYLEPSDKPPSTGGYVEDVTWEHHCDEDRPKGSFVRGESIDCTSDHLCTQLGITIVELNRYRKAFQRIAELKHNCRFGNKLKLLKKLQPHLSILLDLEQHAQTVIMYDPVYGDDVPVTCLANYL